ncbi:MAG: hypothetical protein JW801_08165 [Bacteroidales bacterium]|nr:hypothetical protein [Bacteroidales bacterium]
MKNLDLKKFDCSELSASETLRGSGSEPLSAYWLGYVFGWLSKNANKSLAAGEYKTLQYYY